MLASCDGRVDVKTQNLKFYSRILIALAGQQSAQTQNIVQPYYLTSQPQQDARAEL
eukprot:m.154079 g.154079  ORF g.154079 m.154079 type:complete len:56 (-) comp16378_c0_seq3:1547-1714(-)